MRIITACLALIFLILIHTSAVSAQSVNVVVIVADVPQFITGPEEVVASTTGSPTNEQTELTFTANVIDPESASYYLIICKTDSVTENAGGAPSCPGGQWCVSGQTPNGNDAECSYTTSSSDPETNDWYAFACSQGLGFCGGSSQGAGDSGSPFYVNHAPTLTSISNNSPQDPGGTVTWSVQADDADSVGGNDSVKIFACKSQDFENLTCTYQHWCESTFGGNDPTCDYQVPDIARDSLNHAYIYLVDNHGLVSSSILQGSDTPFSINNLPPSLSSLTLNNGNDIVLNAGTTTDVNVDGIVTDNNSCIGNEVNKVVASLYRSSIGYDNCDELVEADDNNCYPMVDCQTKFEESCQSNSDATLEYECTFSVQYHADPTDSVTLFFEDDWKMTMRAEDENGAFFEKEISQGVELNSLVAIDADPLIGYGSLNVGQTIDPVSVDVRVDSFSNVGLDALMFGTGLSNGQNYEIPVERQRYALEKIPFADASALREDPIYFELNLSKPLIGSSTRPIYWGINVPMNLPAGDYFGENYLVAVKGDVAGW